MEQPMIGLPGGFKDRRGGLIGFGILLILLGCLCALFVAVGVAVGFLMAESGHLATAAPPRQALPGLAVYLAMAVACIWLGIGSIMARRWARALLLVMGWLWLVSGAMSVVVMAFILPKALSSQSAAANAPAGGILAAIMIFTLMFTFVFFVLVPGAMVLFYRSPHVKATCEARDPIPRWTDACPLPVLALSLTLVFSAASMFVVTGFNSVVPFFGVLLHGIPGTFVVVLAASLWGYAAWATYRLQQVGWWIVAIGMLVWATSAMVTFARMDMLEMFRLMGYQEQQLTLMKQTNILGGPAVFIVTAFWLLLAYGYLLYVKRYFRQAA